MFETFLFAQKYTHFHSTNSADHHIYYCIAHLKYLKHSKPIKTFLSARTVWTRTPGLGPLEPVQQRHAKYSNEDITRQIILLSETYTHIQPRTLSKY